MKHYWPLRFGCPAGPATNSSEEPTAPPPPANNSQQDNYDCVWAAHLCNAHAEDGWKTELRRYMDDPMADVTKDIDTVQWWSVSADPNMWCVRM